MSDGGALSEFPLTSGGLKVTLIVQLALPPSADEHWLVSREKPAALLPARPIEKVNGSCGVVCQR
jgi:hypothetical protein